MNNNVAGRVAVESNRIGTGGDQLLAQITGLDAQDEEAVGGKNSPALWLSDRRSESACPAEVGPAPKKRPRARENAGSLGAGRSGRGSEQSGRNGCAAVCVISVSAWSNRVILPVHQRWVVCYAS